MAAVKCDNVRKIVIIQNEIKFNIYFDIDTMEQLTENDVKLCNNIPSIDIDCAVTCNIA